MKSVVLAAITFGAISVVHADAYLSVSNEHFVNGVYSSVVIQGPIDNRSEQQHCAEESIMLTKEAQSNNVSIKRFECEIGARSGYVLRLYKR